MKSWEELCSIGREAVTNTDAGRWLIGDIALEVMTAYRHRALSDFALEIGISKSAAYDYRAMAGFYDADTRARLTSEYPMLTYSHYRVARKAGSLEAALSLIEVAASLDLSVDALRIERDKVSKPVPPRLIAGWDGLAQVEPWEGGYKLVADVPAGEADALMDASGTLVRIKVYEGDSSGL